MDMRRNCDFCVSKKVRRNRSRCAKHLFTIAVIRLMHLTFTRQKLEACYFLFPIPFSPRSS